jgi:ketosteroid isomerase-like protein
MTSREVVEQMLRASEKMDIDAVVALMAPEVRVEWPFRPDTAPERLQGRTEFGRLLTATAAAAPIRYHEYRDVVVHETTDPEVVIVEYEAHGAITATGEPYQQRIVAVFRVHGGQIVSYRIYLDPRAIAKAREMSPHD